MTYEIQFITDERFGGTKKQLQSMDRRLKSTLKDMKGVSLRDISGIREINFGVNQKQWRKKYVISKRSRDHTWNEVMKKVNKIQAPFYKRV